MAPFWSWYLALLTEVTDLRLFALLQPLVHLPGLCKKMLSLCVLGILVCGLQVLSSNDRTLVSESIRHHGQCLLGDLDLEIIMAGLGSQRSTLLNKVATIEAAERLSGRRRVAQGFAPLDYAKHQLGNFVAHRQLWVFWAARVWLEPLFVNFLSLLRLLGVKYILRFSRVYSRGEACCCGLCSCSCR